MVQCLFTLALSQGFARFGRQTVGPSQHSPFVAGFMGTVSLIRVVSVSVLMAVLVLSFAVCLNHGPSTGSSSPRLVALRGPHQPSNGGVTEPSGTLAVPRSPRPWLWAGGSSPPAPFVVGCRKQQGTLGATINTGGGGLDIYTL